MRDTEKLTQNEAKILYDIPIYRTVAQATVLLLFSVLPFLLHGRQVTIRLHQLIDEQPSLLRPVRMDRGMACWSP
jgi:hypothetical protein